MATKVYRGFKGVSFEPLVKERQKLIVITLAPGKSSYLRYRVEGDKMYVDEVYTPEEFRGRGLASKLMEAAVAYAKEKKLRVVPVCSYARRYLEARPELRDSLIA